MVLSSGQFQSYTCLATLGLFSGPPTGLTLADMCQDGGGNGQTCDRDLQCCKCTGGCCTSEENDLCAVVCQDANGVWQTCPRDFDLEANECCRCTGGCCTSEENDVCETVRTTVADPEIYFGWCQPRLRGYKGMHIYNTDYDRFK